jgi:hypothetical protein
VFAVKMINSRNVKCGITLNYRYRLILSKLFFSSRDIETGSCWVAQAGLELTILLFLPSKCWDFRLTPSCLASSKFFMISILSIQAVHYLGDKSRSLGA